MTQGPCTSRLAQAAAAHKSPLLEGLSRALANPYDAVASPNGVVNLGTAENHLMFPELLEKLNSSSIRQVTEDMLKYGTMHGSEPLRKAVANLFNKYLKPCTAIRPDEITIHAGCGATVNNIAQTIANPGEGILVPTPYYGGFDFDLTLYAEARPIHVHTSGANAFKIEVSALERAYQAALEDNITVRALLLTNPQNPHGRALSISEIMPLLRWAKEHNLHVISDEIYALSTFINPNPFVSVLSIPDLPDPEHTHVLWSMSKDFCINGVRVGACVSRNPEVLAAMQMFALFTNTSSLADRAVANLLQDEQWVEWFVEENQKRMKEQYGRLVGELNKMEIPFMTADSGFFVLVNLSKWFEAPGKSGDEPWRKLWYKLLDGGIYILPGEAFNISETGWFRIVFTVSWPLLSLGLERLGQVLDREKQLQVSHSKL
ncbi:uncharacterized protein SPPG_08250 [Spizellomyces punctatus DAOM BR117]|uniref:Aminotransferase class I/classII large domain-containing protein n=1 Tax=Spizellomyces punctatus (strain DAOM BR117) TaxID=645134 RepID=A0A0L0H5U5_SPIPD|nr:uncharacterized protein SPPG_08250 [Spizellomyces punctatus DAOM BR117]KNC96349.1 hypothetical protein SPPG_08250 [Spizellomyces punctatus DAOM BR117]|eukprot:XP_016604389.1 hypothetical protein SPPG_08250 [Spizellomyces punctatus DAOM BR117]